MPEGGCGGTMWGGRRRRSGTSKKTKKMRGGNFYGFRGTVGTNGADWGAVENLAADSATGQILPNNGSELLAAPLLGGRRRRGKGKKATRKGGRKSRRGGPRRRTMRGGASQYSPSNVTAGFAGQGIGGLAIYKGSPVNVPTGREGADGVMQTS